METTFDTRWAAVTARAEIYEQLRTMRMAAEREYQVCKQAWEQRQEFNRRLEEGGYPVPEAWASETSEGLRRSVLVSLARVELLESLLEASRPSLA